MIGAQHQGRDEPRHADGDQDVAGAGDAGKRGRQLEPVVQPGKVCVRPAQDIGVSPVPEGRQHAMAFNRHPPSIRRPHQLVAVGAQGAAGDRVDVPPGRPDPRRDRQGERQQPRKRRRRQLTQEQDGARAQQRAHRQGRAGLENAAGSSAQHKAENDSGDGHERAVGNLQGGRLHERGAPRQREQHAGKFQRDGQPAMTGERAAKRGSAKAGFQRRAEDGAQGVIDHHDGRRRGNKVGGVAEADEPEGPRTEDRGEHPLAGGRHLGGPCLALQQARQRRSGDRHQHGNFGVTPEYDDRGQERDFRELAPARIVLGAQQEVVDDAHADEADPGPGRLVPLCRQHPAGDRDEEGRQPRDP